jgi:hypothetical protein
MPDKRAFVWDAQPGFYTFRKSLLLSKPRDVTYRQHKSLRILVMCSPVCSGPLGFYTPPLLICAARRTVRLESPMTAPEVPSQMQEFNEIAAVILSEVFRTFPIARAIDPDRVADALGLDRQQVMASAWPFDKVFASTLDWLIDEGFVRRIGPLSVDGVVLTTKGMAALNIVPPSLSRPLGKELADATEQASTEGGKRKISELMGNFFGSAIGSFTKTIAG